LQLLEYTSPAIGTVYQNFYEMGRLAVDILLKIAASQDFSPGNYVDFEILPRSSVHCVVN
jgi:DNA-binding LacI/PurR family transcriptional regulator